MSSAPTSFGNRLQVQEIQEMQVQFLGWEDALEEEMAIQPSLLVWKSPWTEQPGRLYHPLDRRKSWKNLWDWTTANFSESGLLGRRDNFEACLRTWLFERKDFKASAHFSHFSYIYYCCAWVLSCFWLFATPWTVAHQAPQSMAFSGQEYWSMLPFSSPEDLPDPGIKPASPALASGFLTTEPPGKTIYLLQYINSSSLINFLYLTICSLKARVLVFKSWLLTPDSYHMVSTQQVFCWIKEWILFHHFNFFNIQEWQWFYIWGQLILNLRLPLNTCVP